MLYWPIAFSGSAASAGGEARPRRVAASSRWFRWSIFLDGRAKGVKDLPFRRGGIRASRNPPLPVEPPVEPMLARLADELPAGGDFLFEPKWDGFRAIVFR